MKPPSCYLRLTLTLLLVFAVTTVGSGYYELTQLVAYHILGNVYRNMSSSVMNSDRVTNHLREDSGTTGPGLNNSLLSGFFCVQGGIS